MKKLFLLISLTFGLIFSAFAQDEKHLNVEIRKNNDLVSTYEIIFNGLPGLEKRIYSESYVKEIKALSANSASGLREIVMGKTQSGTTLRYDKDMIQAVVYDDVKLDVVAVGDANIQKPQNNVYKVEFPANPTHGMVLIARVNEFKISYSLE